MTIAEVLKKTEEKHNNIHRDSLTCDGVHAGDIQQECTGILLTCCPTTAMIQEAIRRDCNLIYCHETTYYHGYDETEWADGTEICARKKALLDQHGIVVYRDHDQVHEEKEDMVYAGIEAALGWKNYVLKHSHPYMFGYEIPETSLAELAKYILNRLHLDGTRIVGDPCMKVKRVCLAAHFFGGDGDRECLVEMEKHQYDVIVPLETVDWTLMEYVLDCNSMGIHKGVINVGHFNLEEAGMERMIDWLSTAVGKDLPIRYAQSGNFFGWISR